MGAWGIQFFEDDQNLDWLQDLLDQDQPVAFFRECLDLSEIDEGEMEYMDCTGVLCTAVMIDALLNGPAESLPEDAVAWAKENQQQRVNQLVPAAIAGLDRLLEDGSEMNDLWKENTQLCSQWKRQVLDLQARLRKSATQ